MAASLANDSAVMKVILIHRWQRPDESLAEQVHRELEKLAELTRIHVAEVTFETSAGQDPPCLVRIHLATAGSDLQVEETEHTAPAALRKASLRISRMLREGGLPRVGQEEWVAEPARVW